MNDFQIRRVEEIEYNPDSIEKKQIKDKVKPKIRGIRNPHEFLSNSSSYEAMERERNK